MTVFHRLIANFIFRARKGLCLLPLMLLTGCELLPSELNLTPSNAGNFNYQQYYLVIKSMDEQQLLQESAQLKKSTTTINEIKLALLYCLPNSPIHNPYNAKAILNKLNSPDSATKFSHDNQAFLVLLKDLLNQQLFVFDKYTKKSQNQTSTIAELAEQVSLLQAQIEQLKKIETSLNNRG